MTLPNFMIIGAMNAGTTSLYRYLRDHPQVFMSTPKELCFFMEDGNWGQGRSWYEGHFEAASDFPAIGEASVGYTMHPVFGGVAARIAELIPHLKLIYMVRHPIERMRTQYLHYRFPDKIKLRVGSSGDSPDDPRRGTFSDPAVAAALNCGQDRRPIGRALLESPLYLNTSLYAMQIEEYLEHFPRSQLLVVQSERLRDDRQTALRRIYRFLGIDERPLSPRAAQEFNRTATRRVPRGSILAMHRISGLRRLTRLVPVGVKQQMLRGGLSREVDIVKSRIPDDVQRRLEDLLREDVRRLRSYIGEDFDGWGIA